jgi:CRP-like cAMP-binding protein
MKRITTISRGKILIILNKVPFFKHFTSFEREKIVDNQATFYVANEDEYIIEQDTLDTAFYILLSGGARVTLEGVQGSVAEMGPGDFFGEIAFILNCPRSSNVIANETCILMKVDRKLLGALNADIREKFKDQVISKFANIIANQNKR